MPTYIKLPGTVTAMRGATRRVVCFVRFSSDVRHQPILADFYRDYLQLDPAMMRREYPEHFYNPRNLAVAILAYHYFRNRGEGFSDSYNECISSGQLPTRPPDASDDDFALWVEPAPDDPPPKHELTKLDWT